MTTHNMNVSKEVVVTTPDEIGVLSRISTAIAESRVNIRAICAYEMGDLAHLRLVTDDNERAIKALERAGFKATEHEVLLCEVSPHVLHSEMDKIVSGYDIKNNYWCASAHSGEHAMLVFSPTTSLKGTMVR